MLFVEEIGNLQQKDFIKQWMQRRKVFVSEASNIPDNLIFVFQGRSTVGISFTILQRREWETTVIVLCEAKVSDEHTELLKSMRPKDRKIFLNNVINGISFAPAAYAFDPDFINTRIPTSIQFSREICYDGLTEDKLNECMLDVVKCVTHVIRQFQEEFGKENGE